MTWCPKPPPATELSKAQHDGWACCWCGRSLLRQGGRSAGRAEGSAGAHDLSVEVYECGPRCPQRPRRPKTPAQAGLTGQGAPARAGHPHPAQPKEMTVTIPPGPMDPPDNPVVPALARMLITDEQFASVRGTVMDANPDMSEELAGRIVDEALKFVAACAKSPGVGLAPSRIVDEGWHALILHTAMYAGLCESLGGFVHHFPGYDPTNYDPPILDRTRETIAALGWEADPELWGPPSDETLVSVAAKCQHAPECTIVVQPKPKPKPG